MEEFIQNSVNAGQESVVGTHVQTETSVNAENQGVTTQQPVQSKEENAAFAEMRRRLEATESKTSKLEKDYAIAKKYGSEYGIYSEDDISALYGASHGIYTLEQFEEVIEQENQRTQYQQSGIDPKTIEQLVQKQLGSNPVIKQTQEYFTQVRIAQEKAALQGKKFFKELEPDIDKVLKANPNLPVDTIYNYLKGQKLEELLEKETKLVAGQAIESHLNQSKRNTEPSDTPPSQQATLDFTASEKAWAERGVKRGTYKDLKEAWEWLRGKKKI
jgi:hypothetical protein